MSILVGTTLTTYAMSDPELWGSWLSNAATVRAELPGERVDYFAAIETDDRGLDPFGELLARLHQLNSEGGRDPALEFQLNDGRDTVTQANRLAHITLGQNLVSQRAADDVECTHLLFMAADCRPPDDVLPRLLELDHPYVGPIIPTYGDALRGHAFGIPVQSGSSWRSVPCEYAMPSAACVLLARRVFTRLRWRYDLEHGLSDDPAMAKDARELLGVSSIVRIDLEARHYPAEIGPVEHRYPGTDLSVQR